MDQFFVLHGCYLMDIFHAFPHRNSTNPGNFSLSQSTNEIIVFFDEAKPGILKLPMGFMNNNPPWD